MNIHSSKARIYRQTESLEFQTGLPRARKTMWEADTTEEATRSKSWVVADLVSEGKHCRRAEEEQGSQWPRAPISMMNSVEERPLASRALNASW